MERGHRLELWRGPNFPQKANQLLAPVDRFHKIIYQYHGNPNISPL
jgi:hypothetical protein